jgi:hypothetical protein
MRPIASHLRTFLFLALSGLSTWLLAIEIAPHGLGPLAQKAASKTSEKALMPLSLSAFQFSLNACDRELARQSAAFKTAKTLLDDAAHCSRLANHAIALMPTYGLAYLVAARAAHVFGDDTAATGYLSASQEFAPFEGWIAKRRFIFAANQLGAETVSLSRDLANLLTIQSGAELVAGYFVHRPELQMTIATVAQNSLSPDFQRFLNVVRARQAAQ